MIIEECTRIRFFVGTAVNSAQNNLLPEISIRKNIVEQFKDVAQAIEKTVEIEYF